MSRSSLAERLLLGFLTDPTLGDAILGDLTEEWRTRIARDGRISARLWIWGQAIRTIPHLLRDWWVNATPRDVGLRLAGILVAFDIAALPAAVTHVMANTDLAVARLMLGSFSAVDGGNPLTINWLTIVGTPLAVSAVCALAGAYVVGSRSRIAPLVSVFWLGAAWIALSGALALALQWPAWYVVALPAVVGVATALGGILAVSRSDRVLQSPR
jgi:hypothetical protein